jgi:hypothetical protein
MIVDMTVAEKKGTNLSNTTEHCTSQSTSHGWRRLMQYKFDVTGVISSCQCQKKRSMVCVKQIWCMMYNFLDTLEHNKLEFIHTSIPYPRSSTQPSSLAGFDETSLRRVFIVVFGRRQIYRLMVKFRNFRLSFFFWPRI